MNKKLVLGLILVVSVLNLSACSIGKTDSIDAEESIKEIVEVCMNTNLAVAGGEGVLLDYEPLDKELKKYFRLVDKDTCHMIYDSLNYIKNNKVHVANCITGYSAKEYNKENINYFVADVRGGNTVIEARVVLQLPLIDGVVSGCELRAQSSNKIPN